MRTFAIISLGCPRNLLDSEVIAGSLKKTGLKMSQIDKGADLCVINTCAFIESARKESIDAILQAVQLKKEGIIKRLIVCGCLPQGHGDELSREIPEIDLILGTSDFPGITELVKKLDSRRYSRVSDRLDYLYDEHSPRFILTPPHYAYVKISEGCSNFCSYCIISKLRGEFRSRTIESVVKEVMALSRKGKLKEVNLIGQDTTLFGIDRYGKPELARLLKSLCEIKNSVRWYRILYTHPAHYTDELLSTIRNEARICKYLDLPIQHIADNILKRMNRHTTKKDIIKLIAKIRRKIPGIVLRTSVIVGFPGETEKDFKELLGFLEDTKFERLGAFIYSKESSTEAAKFKSQVPEKVKQQRFDEIMKLQQRISAGINKSFMGKRIEVLIDEKVREEKDTFLGRIQGDAPEVDGSIYVSGRNLKAGEFYKVKVTDTMEYDLAGEAA